MVIPIFISSEYKQAKESEQEAAYAADEVAPKEEAPRTLRVRSLSSRNRFCLGPYMCFALLVLLATVGVTSYLVGTWIVQKYGGHERVGWCKVEYAVEPFNRKAQRELLYGHEPALPRDQLPKTDEWIRISHDSFELESTGEFNYKIVSDVNSDMTALKFIDFMDGNNYCFIGSRFDFGLPSYQTVQDFLEKLEDKAEIMVDHVSEIMFLEPKDLLDDSIHLEPAIQRLCGGPGIRRYSVAAINPDSDPGLQRLAQAETLYYTAESIVDAIRPGNDVNEMMSVLKRLQEVMAYVPSGSYITHMPGGKVVSFEIVHPRAQALPKELQAYANHH